MALFAKIINGLNPLFLQKSPSQIFDRVLCTRVLLWILVTYRNSHRRCSVKFHKIHRKTPLSESLFEQSCRPQACNFIKRHILAEVISCESCEISKNTFFTEHHWRTASDIQLYTKLQIGYNNRDQLVFSKLLFIKISLSRFTFSKGLTRNPSGYGMGNIHKQTITKIFRYKCYLFTRFILIVDVLQ